MVLPHDSPRGTLARSQDFAVTPVRYPATKGSMQWFQKKHEQWQRSPRGKVSPLPPGFSRQPKTPGSSSSLADKPPLRQTAIQPVASSSQKSPFSSFKPSTAGTPPLPLPKSSTTFATPTSTFSSFSNENSPKFSTVKTSLTSSSPLAATPIKESIKDPPSTPATISHRERLIQFYKKHNPGKVDTVDATLASYHGKEELLFRKLEQKYVTGKDGMLPPTGSGPQCFMDFRVDGQSIGRVVIQLFEDKAPLACENFRCLCTGEKGKGQSTKDLCFNQSKIHRLVPGMCIQGGDFTKGDGTGGESIYPPNSKHGDMWGKFKDETPFLMHTKKGLLSMANNGPNRNGSQFFFTLKALPYLDGKHVVFGEIVQGMDVVDEINKLERDKKERPLKTVMIEDCGQLVDGSTEVRATQSAKEGTPQQGGSTFGAFGLPPAKQQSPFGGGSNPFASFSLSNNNTVSAFSFGVSTQSKPEAGTKSPLDLSAAASSKPGSAFSFGVGSEKPSIAAVSEGASTSGSSSAFPPMSSKAPTPFGASAKTANSSGSSSAFPPMPSKAPTPFGASAKTPNSSGSSSAFPPMSSKAPTPFGASAKTPNSSGSSTAFPPMSSKAPIPFGASAKALNSSGSSSAFPPMSSKAPTPFGASAKAPNAVSPFSFGVASKDPPLLATTKTSDSQPSQHFSQLKTENKTGFGGAFGSAAPTSPVSFSFGSAAGNLTTAKPDDATKMDSSKLGLSSFAKPTSSAFSFGKPAEKASDSVEKPVEGRQTSTTAAPTFSFGTPAEATSTFSFGKPAEKPSAEKSVEPNPGLSTTTPTFSLGKLAEKPASIETPVERKPNSAPFAFGKPAEKLAVEPSVAPKPTSTTTPLTAFSFGKPTETPGFASEKAVAPKPTSTTATAMPDFSFGKATEQPAASDGNLETSASTSKPTFSFGELPDQLPKPAWATTPTKPASSFGKPSESDTLLKKSVAPSIDAGTTTATTPAKSAFTLGIIPAVSDKKPETPKPAATAAFCGAASSFGKSPAKPETGKSVTANPPLAATTASKSSFSVPTSSAPALSPVKALQPALGLPSPAPKLATPSKQDPVADTKPPKAPVVFGTPATAEASKSRTKLPFTVERTEAGSQSVLSKPASRRGTPSPAKPMLPSFYFGEDKSSAVAVIESTPRKQVFAEKEGTVTRSESTLLAKKLATATVEQAAVSEHEDVSFASFSPNFIESKAQKAAFQGFAQSSKSEQVSPTSQAPQFQKRDKLKKAAPKSAQKSVLGGIIPDATCPKGTRRSREVEEAVADILAERIFGEGDLFSRVSVEQVEWLMAAPVERKIEILEHIDSIEKKGKKFTWNDIEITLRHGRAAVEPDAGQSAENCLEADVVSCSSSNSGSLPSGGAALEVWLNVDGSTTTPHIVEMQGEDSQRDVQSVRAEKRPIGTPAAKTVNKEPKGLDSKELLLLNLETLN